MASKLFKYLELGHSLKYAQLIQTDYFYVTSSVTLSRCTRANFCTSSNLGDKDKEKKDKEYVHKDNFQQLPKVTELAVRVQPAVDARQAVTIAYHRGLPQITVPLPSRKENCRFTLRPISNTVGDFIEMLKNEDKGIDRVAVQTMSGVRIAASNTIENLLEEHFKLIINDTVFPVTTPPAERLTQEEINRLSDVKNLVNQLYEALNVDEHQLQKERQLASQLELLKQELEPMEVKRQELELVVDRKTNILTWVGLGLMSVQFGILARLTWWEYSWDIMEPVTYFVTYGTAMAAYAYFVLTKQEYILPDVKDRQHLLTLHKKAKKIGLDLNQYNTLKDKVRFLEKDLRRLRDPLSMKLPPNYTDQFLEKYKKETTIDKLKKLVSLKSKHAL